MANTWNLHARLLKQGETARPCLYWENETAYATEVREVRKGDIPQVTHLVNRLSA
jgi:hypothetical protein